MRGNVLEVLATTRRVASLASRFAIECLFSVSKQERERTNQVQVTLSTAEST